MRRSHLTSRRPGGPDSLHHPDVERELADLWTLLVSQHDDVAGVDDADPTTLVVRCRVPRPPDALARTAASDGARLHLALLLPLAVLGCGIGVLVVRAEIISSDVAALGVLVATAFCALLISWALGRWGRRRVAALERHVRSDAAAHVLIARLLIARRNLTDSRPVDAPQAVADAASAVQRLAWTLADSGAGDRCLGPDTTRHVLAAIDALDALATACREDELDDIEPAAQAAVMYAHFAVPCDPDAL